MTLDKLRRTTVIAVRRLLTCDGLVLLDHHLLITDHDGPYRQDHTALNIRTLTDADARYRLMVALSAKAHPYGRSTRRPS